MQGETAAGCAVKPATLREEIEALDKYKDREALLASPRLSRAYEGSPSWR